MRFGFANFSLIVYATRIPPRPKQGPATRGCETQRLKQRLPFPCRRAAENCLRSLILDQSGGPPPRLLEMCPGASTPQGGQKGYQKLDFGLVWGCLGASPALAGNVPWTLHPAGLQKIVSEVFFLKKMFGSVFVPPSCLLEMRLGTSTPQVPSRIGEITGFVLVGSAK